MYECLRFWSILTTSLLLSASGLGCIEGDDDTADDDTADDDDDAGDDDTADDDSADGEVASFVVNQSCAGCQDLVLFGAPPISEMDLISVDVCFDPAMPLLFAAERLDAAVRALPVGSCDNLDPSVFDVPSATCHDAGAIDLAADWPGWEWWPLDYSSAVGGYPSQVAYGPAIGQYAPGLDVTLDAAGGADIAAFSITRDSVTPLRLLTPVVDGDHVDNIPFDQPLEVTWEGGDEPSLRLYLLGEWVTAGQGRTLMGCHVPSGGSFTVPADALSAFDPGQVTQLWLSERRQHALGIAEIEGAGWTLGSTAYSYVFYDPAAVP